MIKMAAKSQKRGERMALASGSDDYFKAVKRGQKELSQAFSAGVSAQLPSLVHSLGKNRTLAEISLGTIDIPLSKVKGTYTDMRSNCFSKEFMPLLDLQTEFASKWIGLIESHMEMGIRDPIKAYEYLNYFYVVEGNKRVSVLKYLNASTVMGVVTRIMPQMDKNDLEIQLYYEFLTFYQKTKINALWFTKLGSFSEMADFLARYHLEGYDEGEKYKVFVNHIYYNFRKSYKELGGDRLDLTTADAFLEYVKVYGIPTEINEEFSKKVKKFIPELEGIAAPDVIDVQTELPTLEKSMLGTLTNLVTPNKPLKVAFVYAGGIQDTSWSYAHELGRLHVENVLAGQVETTYVENVPQNEQAYDVLVDLAVQGYDIIFTTLPVFLKPTLKAALEFPTVKFLNCSSHQTFQHVNTYFARIHEPRFLCGVIAGAMTKTGVIGYEASYPIPEVVNSINAYALGAKMVRPDVKVQVEWLYEGHKKSHAIDYNQKPCLENCDVILRQNSISLEVGTQFGLYMRKLDGELINLALPIWNWGIVYEQILKEFLNIGARAGRSAFYGKSKHINFWWGMDVGVVDLFYSSSAIPTQLQKLLELLKKAMKDNTLAPFTGPIHDQAGKLRVRSGRTATVKQITEMDWFSDVVACALPPVDEIENATIEMLDVES
ncbi:MAG: BMP family ABC transporter substrate-binding protein [Hyphomonadaceae bacterium]|nr:BMP family ABC transporter substrate-binding protein [Clostridia bacterium]